jgi:hypothetical protein
MNPNSVNTIRFSFACVRLYGLPPSQTHSNLLEVKLFSCPGPGGNNVSLTMAILRLEFNQ